MLKMDEDFLSQAQQNLVSVNYVNINLCCLWDAKRFLFIHLLENSSRLFVKDRIKVDSERGRPYLYQTIFGIQN